jgi:uncharacterized membrane protein
MTFDNTMEWVVRAFEIAGVLVFTGGAVMALWHGARPDPAYARGMTGWRQGRYQRARHDLGRAILLGLEILIIADIIQTITIDATIESAATLAIIVLVRTFLSFSLDIELEGMAPWRRADVELAHPGADVEKL